MRRSAWSYHSNRNCQSDTAMPLDQPDTGSQQTVWTFDKFKIDDHIGTSIQIVDQQTYWSWNSLYKSSHRKSSLPYGISQLIVMRAYTEVVQPRPPSNIHAAFNCRLIKTLSLSKEVQAKVFCVNKYMRRKRKMVDFRVNVSDSESGVLLCSATLGICWSK